MDKKDGVALYHRVMRRENFETAAKDIFDLLVSAQLKQPNQPRYLYVDIDGHRNEEGGFDKDMLELQREFGLGFLLPYFTEVHFPLIEAVNTHEQNNSIPENLLISGEETRKSDDLSELYVENYGNTEFVSEEDVYEYLKKVSAFLRKYNDMDVRFATAAREDYDPCAYLLRWRMYI